MVLSRVVKFATATANRAQQAQDILECKDAMGNAMVGRGVHHRSIAVIL
jgi:hypothetical protein